MKKTMQEPFDLHHRGWVKLDRGLLDSPIIKSPTLSQIYTWCLLKANHQSNWVSLIIGKGTTPVQCKRGQFIMGRKTASEYLGMPESTFYKNINRIKDFGYIKIESNKHYSIVTVINYDCCADSVSSTEQPKEQEKNNELTTKEQPSNTDNNKKNIKNYNKDNSLYKIEKYNKFLSNPIFTKSDKNLFAEYEKFVSVICSELPKVLSLNPAISPEQYIGLRVKFNPDQIVRKIKDVEAWGKFTYKHNLLALLERFLERDNKKSNDGVKRNSQGVPIIDLSVLDNTDGNTKDEIDEMYIKYKDEMDWSRYHIIKESMIKKHISKWLRLNKYIMKSSLFRLKRLRQLRLPEFVKLCYKFEILLSLTDSEFEDVKGALYSLNSWDDLDDHRSVGKALFIYYKNHTTN